MVWEEVCEAPLVSDDIEVGVVNMEDPSELGHVAHVAELLNFLVMNG